MDMRFIEVAIGLALVFALSSLLVTTVTEIWSSFRGRRGANLELALRSMLADDPSQAGWRGWFRSKAPTAFTSALLNHPLLVSQSQGKEGEQGKPSYVPGDLVVAALLDLLAQTTPGGSRPETPRLLLNSLNTTANYGPKPPVELLKSLGTLVQGVEGDWQAYEKRLVAWFDSIGERSIGWYKRWNQVRLGAFGFLVAAVFNVNPFVVGYRLWNEEPLRRATVAAAESANTAFKAASAASAASAPPTGADADTQRLAALLLKTVSAAASAASAPALTTTSDASPSSFPVTAAGSDADVAVAGIADGIRSVRSKSAADDARIRKLLVLRLALRARIDERRASVADDDVPTRLLEDSASIESLLMQIRDTAAEGKYGDVERAVLDAEHPLRSERNALLERALPSPSARRCRAAINAEARLICERIEGVRSLGDGGLPIGWNWENLPGCEDGQCGDAHGGTKSRADVRVELKAKISEIELWARQKAIERCRETKEKSGAPRCEELFSRPGQDALRAEVEGKLHVAWNDASASMKVEPVSPGTVFAKCMAGDVPCNRLLMFMGWLVIGIASVLGAQFWFDLLGKMIQLRGSGAKPAEEGKAAPAGATGGPPAAAPGGGMLTPPTLTPAASISAGSASALSAAELALTADQIERIQKSGLNMPEALVTRRLDTETRKRVAIWQDAEQQVPADGVLTQPQIERLLRGSAPPPTQPPAPVAPGALGTTPVRSDGTIAPLQEQEIRDAYGDIATVEDPTRAGAVKVVAEGKPGGRQRVLEVFKVPASMAHAFPVGLKIHQCARPHLEAVLQDIDTAGLAHLIEKCDGTVVERHISWNPANRLSSHTWGIAIDINAAQNPQGSAPAAQGTDGSVWELVPIFNRHGFAWGGHFRNGGPDGMHFELALRTP